MRIERRSAPAAIGLTALIDVVFILVLFFLLATRFDRPVTIDIALAGAAPETVLEPQRITVSASGLTLDGVAVAAGDLALRLATTGSEAPVVIMAGEGVVFEMLAPVFAALTEAGRHGALAVGAGE